MQSKRKTKGKTHAKKTNYTCTEEHDDDGHAESGEKKRDWKERDRTRKGEEKEAVSWQGITLSSCMLRKLFGTQR